MEIKQQHNLLSDLVVWMNSAVYRKAHKIAKRVRRPALSALLILCSIAVLQKYNRGPFEDGNNGDSVEGLFQEKFRVMNSGADHLENDIRGGTEKDLDPNSIVIVTAVNYAFRSHLANLRCSLERLGLLEQLRVVALDSKVSEWAKSVGFSILEPADEEDSFSTTGDAQFGSESFNLLSKRKIGVVERELAEGKNVLFTDADMFWCINAVKDVVSIIQNIPDADLLMQSAWPRALLNSGFYFVRSNPRTIKLFKELRKHGGPEENDQVIFNFILCQKKVGGSFVHSPDDELKERHLKQLLGCRRNDTFAAVLDRERYPTGGEIINGEKIFLHGREELTSMCDRGDFAVIHNNCILSHQKTARFTVKGFWYAGEDNVTCNASPAPVTSRALKKCGIPKCGRVDLRIYKKLYGLKGLPHERPPSE